jgi:hypothetical protein
MLAGAGMHCITCHGLSYAVGHGSLSRFRGAAFAARCNSVQDVISVVFLVPIVL